MQSYQTRIAMGFINLLIYCGLIFIIVTISRAEDTGNNSREIIDYCLLSDNIVPVHYNIKLIPYTEESEFIFLGECNVTIKICLATRNISLHTEKLQLNKTATTLISNNGGTFKPRSYNYHNKTYITDFIFDNELPPASYVLHVRYFSNTTTNQQSQILYTDEEGYKLWLIMKPFPSVAVRQDLRCFDDPALSATYNISVKYHQKYKTLSNMPVSKQYTDVDGMIWSHFDTTPRMTSCTPMVVVLNFDRVPNANETVNMWCRSNCISKMQFAQSVVEKVRQHMVQYTNISEKVPKTDHIAIPNLGLEGFSNWGLIIYNERSIIYDNNEHDVFHKRKVTKLMAHEMLHQWFGNLIHVSRLSDIWLSEGFASFFEAYILNKIFEDWRTMNFLVIDSLHGSLRTDTSSIMKSLTYSYINSVENMPDYSWHINTRFSEVYDKAPVILRMLQHIITEEIFRKGVIIYLSTRQFKSASSDDLWTAMQTALDESDISYKNFKIKEVMDPWINQIHYPLVTVTRNYETGEVIISQKHYRFQEDKEENVTDHVKWWIPITYTTQTNPDFTNTALNFRWLSPRDENISIEINKSDWLILNLQQTGYYRINYDPVNWRRIAIYLNNEDYYTKIHVLNRAQIIDDAFAFVMEKQLHSSIFLDILNYLSRETDYVAWYPMFHIISRLSTVFSLPEATTVKSKIAEIFNRLLENVGSDENPNENYMIKQKRQLTLYWACDVGNPICQRMATIKLDQHLANLDSHVLSPFWYEWIYCSGLMAANTTTWSKVFKLFEQTRDKKLLEYLTCSEDPHIIINYLNITSNISIMSEEEHKLVFSFIVKKHACNNLVLDYILENFERVKPKLVSSYYALANIILGVVSKKQLDKIQEFVKNNINEDSSASIQRAINEHWITLQYYMNTFSERFSENRISMVRIS